MVWARKPRSKKPENLDNKIISALRNVFRWCDLKKEALRLARDPKKWGHSICAKCGGSFNTKLVAIDHHDPVVGPDGFIDWNTYVKRLFCEPGNLKCLCDTCHSVKTKEENAARALVRRETKKLLKPAKAKKPKKDTDLL